MDKKNFPLSELSTREEVADFICSENNLKDDVKNILIDEHISGDVLPELSIKDMEELLIKLGPRKKINKFILENKDNFKEKVITEKIFPNSNSKEVKTFFEQSLGFTGELNSLDGKGLLELTEEKMKELGLKFGQRKRLIKYIEYFKTLKPPDEEEEDILITKKSSEEEVAKFLKLRLKFSQDSINSMELDGESLFDLKEEDVDDIKEITEEEKENLKKFLRGDFDKKQEELKIGLKSSFEEICNFLKKKLNFSDEAIKSLKDQDIDTEVFFSLTEDEINDFDGISELEKEKLNLFLSEYKNEQEEKEPKLFNENLNKDDAKTSKEKIIFSEKDSQKEEEKIKNEKIKDDDKNKNNKKEDKIKQEPEDNKRDSERKEKKMKEENKLKLRKESSKEDIIKFLEKLNLNLEKLTLEELNKITNIQKEDKEIIKNFLKKDIRPLKKNIDNNEDKSKETKFKTSNKVKNFLYDDKKNIPKAKADINKKERPENDQTNNIRKNNKDEGAKNKKDKKDTNTNILKNQIIEQYISKEEKSNVIKFAPLSKFAIGQLKNSNFNIFFFITLADWQANSAEISIYIEEGSYFSRYYSILKGFLISQSKYESDKGRCNYFYLFQVPLSNQIKKLNFSIKIDKNGVQNNASIYTNNIENYFQVNNLKYDSYEDFPFVNANTIFSEYLDFFRNKDNIYGEKMLKSLIKGLMHKISTEYNIKLTSSNFFRILKLCAKFGIEVKNFEYLEVKKNKIDSIYYITDEDIDKINSKKKYNIIELIVKILFDLDEKYLMKLIKGKNGPYFCRNILDLLYGGFNLNNFIKNNSKEDFEIFKKLLLSVAKNHNEVEYIVNITKGLTSSLNFIKENIDIFLAMESKFFPINLEPPNNNDDINTIYLLVNDIINKSKEINLKIINLENLFINLLNFAYFKDLKELCKLHNFVKFIAKERKIINNFYQKIHEKGMTLIRNNKLTTEEIFTFIMTQDYYYYDPINNKSNFRDPEIFAFIPITKRKKDDNEYLKNIEIIKKNRLFELFSESSYKVLKRFQEILLEQMTTMSDLKSIFDIFPHKLIDQGFTFLINGIVHKLQYTLLDEENEKQKILFEIFDNWLQINFDNGLDLKYCCKILEINYDFTSKYYFHVFRAEKLQKIIEKIRANIIEFFLGQNNQNNCSSESLIILLENTNNEQSRRFVLNQMGKFIMTEEDFYQKEENERYKLFKLFWEKCRNFYNNHFLIGIKYLDETLRVKDAIIQDIKRHDISYELINNLIDEPEFLKKLKNLLSNERMKVNDIFSSLKKEVEICRKRFEELEKINDYLNSFFNTTKLKEIEIINKSLLIYKQKNISEIIDTENFFEDEEDFNFEELQKESENLKYKDSCFFMAIYNSKKNNEGLDKSEGQIFFDSIEDYRKTIEDIINQKESKQPFFEINNVMEIMKEIQNPSNDLKKEINFISEEFVELEKDNYIKNNLLNDLINFSNKDKISKLIQSIIYFIQSFNKIKKIETTNFLERFEKAFNTINSNGVSGDEIKEAIDLLKKYDYDIKKETGLTKFYELLLGKEDAIIFIKTIKDRNLEIRNLNEFIDESETSELQTSDIDNLLNVYSFFDRLIVNKSINTDENLLKIFKSQFLKEKHIEINLQNYLNTYGEIIQLYESYGENPEMTVQKIQSLLENSTLYLFKDEKNDLFTFKLEYRNKNNNKVESSENQLEELRNKILLTSTTLNNEENNDKSKLTKKYIKLIENLTKLTKTLNSLLKAGYPDLNEFTLKIRNSEAYDEKENTNLQKLMKDYKIKNKNFRESIKNGFGKFPLLRLFYGKQFIQIYENLKNKNIDISHLINSVTLNQIKNTNIDYKYNNRGTLLENINSFLEKLFRINNIKISEIYNRNLVLSEYELSPGLYRKTKSAQNTNSNLINNILNIYLNLTGNIPIINTLLICNEDTSIEQIRAFLYRAFFCETHTLFLICNMEYLDLSASNSLIRTLKELYRVRKGKISSYILFIYEKVNSGLVRDLEKLIPEKNIISDSYLANPENKNKIFDNVEVYSSKFSGYGKTTEIIYKVKNCKGDYRYLPIGGTINRDYVINNLINLNLNLQNGKTTYLHLDLSETDNDDLMNEILFKLLILRYLDSNEKIYYLGYDINILIEIPNGFGEFDKKYKILSLFKKISIDNLRPLRLEENVNLVKDSNISIVAEVLSFYDQGKIDRENINLEAQITKSAAECEQIINKHFTVKNQNYYQKMNFIKILAVQFTKFTKDVFFDCSIVANPDVIAKARRRIISNFISLTQVFTKSPFDTVLLRQKQSMEIFGNYDDAKMKEDEINILADERDKTQVFSFDLIKPSLVFFNKDGHSISIITNNDKNDNEYQNLKELWNSQIPEGRPKEELKDYKNMQHDKFVEQIKILFSLNKKSEQEIKDICEKLGNYIFVSDNFIKMVRILLNIEAKIPVILMGETGVGKTKLLEMLATLYGDGTCNWKKLQIHAGTTDKKIIKFIERVTKEVIEEGRENEKTWIFLDEINTCNSLGLITEIMCNHTYLGKKINPNFVFLAACNPYRVLTRKMRESGLVYYNLKEKNKLNNLVYTVNPLPHSLLNFIFDFGSLKEDDEKKYITNTIISILEKIKKDNIIGDISDNDLVEIRDDIINSIVICHNFIREKYDKSAVSMREIRRFGIFLEYFIKNINDTKKYKPKKKMNLSLNMTLYLCYYLRLNDKKYREELSNHLNRFFKDKFLHFPEKEVEKLTELMSIEKGKGIALNRALKENLFTCYTCIVNTVPLIIVGKPGTGKSLSFQILYNTLKGDYSEKEFFKKDGKLYRYYYQGSETSTAKGIKKVFKKALNAKNKIKNQKKKDEEKNEENKIEEDKKEEKKEDEANKKIEEEKNKNIYLVFFDEMGLAERSSNNPLKVIHYLLEKDTIDSVPFLGISNWRLDAAKINRAVNLSITDYDISDLEGTAMAIARALDSNLANTYEIFLKALARTYNDYIKLKQNGIKETKDFHGNRDFYNLIKTAMRELILKKEELPKHNKRILTEVGIQSLNRNFGGIEETNTKILEFFKNQYKNKFDETVNINKSFSVLEAIEKNVSDPNSRYLMLISDGNNGSEIVKYLLKKLKKKYIELVGSKYTADMKSGKYIEEILNKVKYIMETDNVMILRDLDIIYPSLYDLFNQNFSTMGEKKYARIAFEYAKVSSLVNNDFHAIVIVNREQIKKLSLDPPFLNRFEKHIITYNMLLNEKEKEISNKISNYLELVSTFNNNKNLKIDLDKLLINCKEHQIESLIFKIKNDLITNNKMKYQELENKYEQYILTEVFKKIVPTFCQDIIASILNSNLPQEYNKYQEIVLDIYKQCKYDNFNAYFKKLPSKKNIIYTFSKSTESILEDERPIDNKFGSFNSQSIVNLMSDSFKSNDSLIQKFQEFIEHEKNKLLIIRFTEKDLFIINSISHIISVFEKENPKLKEKLIIFIIHKQRLPKNYEYKKTPDLIPFINEEYSQIFIDNLVGKENLNILKIMEKKNEELVEQYIYNSNFIENKIFITLNYINYNIFYETKDLNKKNYTTKIAEKIIANDKIKELILNNIKKQGNSIKGIIKDIFVSDNMEINDVDIFEVIRTKLSTYFCSYLLKIIFYAFKENILNQLLCNPNYELILQNDYFLNLINKTFEKTKFNFVPSLKMRINGNNVDVYNDFKIPKSKPYFNLIIEYVKKEIIGKKKDSLIDVEQSLRKNLTGEKIEKAKKEYTDKIKRFEENLKVEINEHEIFKAIFNQNNIELKILLMEDYLKYYIVIYSEKNNVNYLLNEKLLSFLKLIIKAKLSDTHNHRYEFNGSIQEFIKIILFTQVYMNEIKCFLDIFIEVYKYCENLEGLMIKILNEEKIKYEISERNKAYTEDVNINFFNIMESLIRAILIYGIEINKKDKKIKFYEYLYALPSIEANLQKINKKLLLYSKEIYNIRSIIKIEEAYKSNPEQLENNFERIMNNLLQQSEQFYFEDFNKLYNLILDLIKIFDETLKEKNEIYINLLFFIFRTQHRNIYNEEVRIKLLTHFFKNKLLLIKSKIFLSETLKDIKPEVPLKKGKKSEEEIARECVNNFMNLETEKLKKFKSLIDICKNIDSPEFSEILLYFFEGQCQSYFSAILQKNGNKYNLKCCQELLLNNSIEYLKKAIHYLYLHKNNNDNNLLKLYAIAYIKTYCYYYVDINFTNKDNCNWKEINEVFGDKDDENNKDIRKVRNIYFWRLYCKKFENFEQFIGFNFSDRDVVIYKELQDTLEKEKNSVKYIFKESFIVSNPGEKYKKMAFDLDQKNEINFEGINDNFDFYYCFFVNKIISYLYDGRIKNDIIQKMQKIYDSSNKEVKMGDEGKKLYNYLLDNKAYEEKIVKKISDHQLAQDEFEILLYSFRFIFNSQINDTKCFHNEILKKNSSNFIQNNFIPGSFPTINEYLKSYNILKEKLEKKLNLGYYICKDCGFLYEVQPCTYPMAQDYCPNGHVIGGLDHRCTKTDIRVFLTQNDANPFRNCAPYNFVINTLDEFKINYVDKYMINPAKGIIKDYEYNEFERNDDIRDINIISFRILNFILYSYILGSYILDNINQNEAKNYLVENLFPHTLFGIIKKNWELLDASLKKLGVENIQVFMNMIFPKMNEFICNLKTVNTVEQLTAFEKIVNDYIMGILSDKNKIENLNKSYQKINNELLLFDPNSMKEIILGNYEPSIYDKKAFPDLQYYTLSKIENYDAFVKKFQSSKENEKNYSLINLLLKKDEDLTQNAMNMKSLENLNKLSNMLINLYSFNISREDAKTKIFKQEWVGIIEKYNQIAKKIIFNNEGEFEKEYVKPFIESWDIIKRQCVQYKCKILGENKEQQYLDMNENLPICCFLVDNGDIDGGMYLASAYQHLIEWQNAFLDLIISKNNMNGIFNSYVSQLEQQINIQDATKDEIINIDDKTYKSLETLITSSSLRNIFSKDKNNNIIYKNYNDIIYNYDYIEEELGKIILPGLKKFKPDEIKFVIYLYEAFRGDDKSSITQYNDKYAQKPLSEDEKQIIGELLKNNNVKLFNDIFSSLLILMIEVIKENYASDTLICDIIEKLPNYIIINKELVDLLKNTKEQYMNEKVFTINNLVSIYEYFEALCWPQISKNILEDYTLILSDESKQHVIDYFKKNENQKKIINIQEFTFALRRLISRFLAGSRQEIDIKSDLELILYINKNEFWSKEIADNDEKDNELQKICHKDIKIGNAWDLYNALDGDTILNKFIDKSKKKEIENNNNLNKKVVEVKEEDEIEMEINTNEKQDIKKKDDEQEEEKIIDDDEDEEKEEEEDEIDDQRDDY